MAWRLREHFLWDADGPPEVKGAKRAQLWERTQDREEEDGLRRLSDEDCSAHAARSFIRCSLEDLGFNR
ncbi:hypothetical protein NDU88_001569 [Pleurodeles waltl]|uniref:Uncharacterized protein n=1 Tax=Pleurodeles waltl TaxID=8319 RepID=A0AAV7U8T2_PLEWA|nr:hypothetical protein NDU88_001569 [Pleurodeles waltl]